MDNIANIKNVYLYNKTLHNQVIKKERKKRKIKKQFKKNCQKKKTIMK